MKWSTKFGILVPGLLISQATCAQPDPPPTIAPKDASVIVFASDSDGDFELYRVKPDGSELAQLTENDADDFAPACSPDGKSIAFVSIRTGRHALFVMTDGHEPRKIADKASEITRISWSPDSRHVVWDVESIDGSFTIHVINVDGTGHKQLATEAAMPSWSPDGKTIAFSRLLESPQIFLMDSDGTNVRPLGAASEEMEAYPIWSPDGKQIVFTAIKEDDEGEQSFEIRAVDADGKTKKSILKTEGSALAWSPDGKRVMILSAKEDETEIKLVNIDGTGLAPLGEPTSGARWGCWCRHLEVGGKRIEQTSSH